uniref:Uncharacterized protein n=1 Tax=Monodon monoceros TaxID=40151 RepID=A0A8C6AT67_MONMO
MKPGRSTSPFREITMEPGSKLVSRSDWEPEPHQTPITQSESGPENTPTAQPAPKAQQGPNTQQKRTTQQRPLAQHEAESQQEPRAQQKSALQQEFLAPQEPAPQQSPPIQRVPFRKQEAASQHRPGPGKDSRTQQEPELREGAGAQVGPGPQNGPPAQTELMSQERRRQSDPTAQHAAPAQGAKSQEGSLAEWQFLSKPNEPSIQQPASEHKTFLERVVDSGADSDLGFTLETNSPAQRGGTVAQGMKLVFKGKPGYEVMSGFGGTSLPSKKTSSQNPRHYWNPGKLSWEEGGLPGMVIHLHRSGAGTKWATAAPC